MAPSEYAVWFLFILVVLQGVVWLLNRLRPRLLQSEFPERLARQAQEAKLTQKIAELETTVKVLSESLDEAKDRIAQQNLQIAAQHTQITDLSREVEDLQRELGRLKPGGKIKKKFDGRVLAVWPEPTLDLAGSEEAIAKTGLDYDLLAGPQATRMGVVEQLGQRTDYRIMEIGAKGAVQGIKLHDGMTPPLWWLRLAQQHEIEIFVVLANESSKPGVMNVADALSKGGAKAVVSVDASIEDADAVNFARMFYRRLATGATLKQAVDLARLVITDAGAEAINLWELGR